MGIIHIQNTVNIKYEKCKLCSKIFCIIKIMQILQYTKICELYFRILRTNSILKILQILQYTKIRELYFRILRTNSVLKMNKIRSQYEYTTNLLNTCQYEYYYAKIQVLATLVLWVPPPLCLPPKCTSSRAHEKGCGCSRQIFGWIYFIISFSVDLCKQFYFLCLGVGSIRAQNIEADQQIIIFVVLQSSGLQFIIYMLVKKYLDEHQWLKQGLLLLLLLLLITHTSGNFR
eukprot:TRINITY_DN4247_c1_g1_i4.p1 TRINITY_DN4247_c1_g1~~TRINITY_DN4247_c1_g1_i4.p1  ORF type:complete len:231 (-),score=-13.79 TRINITY_DN4247_c1_g1_i4:102-794(-)